MNSIYLVLDLENDLVHEQGPNGKSQLGEQVRTRQVVERTAAAIVKARAAGVRVGFVRVGFSSDYRECPPHSPVFSAARENGLFKLGAWGADLHPALGAQPQDLQIVKHRVSPFYATTLEAQLRADCFNLTNTAHFDPPNVSLGNPLFGVVSAQGNQPRIVQFALKLNY